MQQQSQPQSPQGPVQAPIVPPGYELKKKGHKGRNLGIGILGLIVAGTLITALSHGSSGPSTPAAKDNNAAATSPGKTATKPGANQSQVLLDKTGNGTLKTATFTTSGPWEIDYSFDNSNLSGAQGNFIVTVYDANGAVVDLPVNALAVKGQDVSHELRGGTYALEVLAEGDWHVVVKG
jgi:hypothetical protein